MSATDLIEAVKRGDGGEVEAALRSGAEIHQQDEHGWTSLNWAAGQGRADLVALLLEHGAEPQRTGRDLRTALDIARAAGHREVVELLAAKEKESGSWRDPQETLPYCRAYYLRDFAAFPDFPAEAARQAADDDEAEGSEPIVYLHHDFTVTASMWHGEDVVYDAITPEWRTFCAGELGFAIPEDLR